MDNINNLLRKVGFTDYEAKVYLALASLITATASQISEESGVPKSKIYDVLKKLEYKGFIQIKNSHPFEYRILPPNDTFERYKFQFMNDLTQLQNDIGNIYESNLPSFTSEVNFIESKEKVVQKQYDLMKRSKKVVLMRIGFVFPSEADALRQHVMDLMDNGIKVKVLAARTCVVNNQEISIESIFENIPVDIKYRKIPTAQLIIKDYNEMLLVFTENIGRSVSEKNTVGLLNTISTIISNYVLAFNKHWK